MLEKLSCMNFLKKEYGTQKASGRSKNSEDVLNKSRRMA